ncbi:DPB11_7 [Sanghuangporus weigelae]
MRKGHGSTKVPGVKLRPAAPTKSSKSGEPSTQLTRLHSSIQDDVDSTEILRSCKKPLVGVVICGSGLSDKVNLYQQAVQLGAQTSSNLTDRVTHLVCESPGTPKYNYCVEHGIPILQPSWISDIYEKWINGESIDVEKIAVMHRFPTFKSVNLCMTAINDIERRKQIQKQLEKNGGAFIETFSKGMELTHLLCGPDRGENTDQMGLTPKMQYAMKYNDTRAKKVHLVWEDWFWDCLEFKGILDERSYLATGPRPPRRIRREPSPLVLPITSTAEQSKQRAPTPSSQFDANADAEETANVKRMPEAAALLWESALKKRGFEMKDGKLLRSPSKSSFLSREGSQIPLSPSSHNHDELATSSRTKSSLNAAFKRTKSFAAKTAEPDATKSAFQRVLSTPAAATENRQVPATISGSLALQDRNQIPEGERILFAGLRFRALGEASGTKLTEALELRGGTVIVDADTEVDFIVVRLVSGSIFYRNELSQTERQKFRTECWIEQCMFEERICAGDEHPAFVPLRIPTPLPGADKLMVHISGLIPSEKMPSVRLLKAIGATVTDQLSRRNTHLICPCGSGPKFMKALEWGIPVLSLQWLFDTVKSGKIHDVDNYLVTADGSSAAPAKSSPEGGMMADITNSEFVQGSSKSKGFAKSSNKSQSSNSSSLDVARQVSSDDWTASALLSESTPANPPTSSPPDTVPTTPSPVRRHTTLGESMLSKRPSVSPFTSPSKSKSMVMERVPSSATPSPMRMPSKNTLKEQQEVSAAAAARTISPSSVPATASTSTLSGESASVLKDAIASLLGKRPSSDDNSNSNSNSNSNNAEGDSQDKAPATQQQQQQQQPVLTTRASKRSKPPPRTKSRQGAADGGSGACSARSFSRTTSLEVLGRTSSMLSGTGGGSGSSAYPFDFTLSSGHFAESPTELFNRNASDAAAEESMRVTYEDPSQRAEERRLFSLISGNGGADVNAMDADVGEDGVLKEESQALQAEGKKPRPKPRRRGRNLVRRVKTNTSDQSLGL